MREDTRDIGQYYNAVLKDRQGRFYRTINEMLPNLATSADVLDYGTGSGIYAHQIALQYGCHIDAVDLDIEALEAAQAFWREACDSNISFFHSDRLFEMDGSVSVGGGYRHKYDLIISSQVMEHVHNVGNYLARVSQMLKRNGRFVVSIPNISTPRDFCETMVTSTEKLMKRNRDMLNHYDKAVDHINGWSPYYFVTLLGSCGFKLEKFISMEGVPVYRRVYIDKKNRRLLRHCSYTVAFRFKKVQEVRWENYD